MVYDDTVVVLAVLVYAITSVELCKCMAVVIDK